MTNKNIADPNSSREWWNDRVISILTLALVLMLFVFAPLQAAGITVVGITVFQVLGFASALMLIGGVFFVSASPIVAAAMVVALAMAVWAAFARLTAPSTFDVYLVAGAWLMIHGLTVT